MRSPDLNDLIMQQRLREQQTAAVIHMRISMVTQLVAQCWVAALARGEFEETTQEEQDKKLYYMIDRAYHAVDMILNRGGVAVEERKQK